MRTTLDIADVVLQAVKERARREKKTAGEVISELARSALTDLPVARAPKAIYGFRPFSKRGGIVNNEAIDRLLAEAHTLGVGLDELVALLRERHPLLDGGKSP